MNDHEITSETGVPFVVTDDLERYADTDKAPITLRELETLRRAVDGGKVPPASIEAIALVKRILGGKIVGARQL